MHFIALRVVAVLALILLLWNPTGSRILPSGDQPIVLLDASLSMSGAPWRAALDSARALARRRGALVWRFGTRVAAFDTTPPGDGASRIGPALEAAAARAGEVIVVTDGALDDAPTLPPDLQRRPRIILQPRPTSFDAFLASVTGPRHVTRGDTVRLRVSYGTAGKRETGSGKRKSAIVVTIGSQRVISQTVTLPDSGTMSTDLTFPVSRIPSPAWSILEVRLNADDDTEPRDNTRLFAIDVSLQPAAVIFAAPPDWEMRFLARSLTDVAHVPVKVFVEAEPGRWRDGATLAPVTAGELTRAAQGARLVVLTGDPSRARPYLDSSSARGRSGGPARLVWSTEGQAGDWYVERPPASPLTGTLSGIVWDSLPPATAAGIPNPRDSGAAVALTARLARRGVPRPIVTLDDRARGGGGGRTATVSAAGLWRWAFRGGASEEAYRSLVAGLVDWLLGERGAGSRERAVPVTLETPNGLPLVWRWTSADEPRALAITLEQDGKSRVDTLRFDAGGGAELALPPGMYRYALAGGPERGVVAVETYSDEWRPRAPSVAVQAGEPTARMATIGLRDRWWLFVLAIAALATEWAWRRRQGLP